MLDFGLLGAWKGYLKHVLSDGGESFGHLRNSYLNLLRALAQDGRSIGAGQHSKPKDRFLLVFFSPLFVFFSISLERLVAAFAASKERACENLRNY